MNPQPIFIKRAGRRIGVSLASRVRCAGMREAEAMIVNISVYGLRAQCAVAFRPGDLISLALPSIGMARAKVAWCHSGYFGAVFSNAVDIMNLMLAPDQHSKPPLSLIRAR